MSRFHYDFYGKSTTGKVVFVAIGAVLTVDESRALMQSYFLSPWVIGGPDAKNGVICAVRTSGSVEAAQKQPSVINPTPAYTVNDGPTECWDGANFFQQVAQAPVLITCGPGFEWSEQHQKCLPVCPQGLVRAPNGSCRLPGPIPNVMFPPPLALTVVRPPRGWRPLDLERQFMKPIAAPLSNPRLVRYVAPAVLPHPRPFAREVIWNPVGVFGTPGTLGAIVTDDPIKVAQGKGSLFAWSKFPGVVAPLDSYGLDLQDISQPTTWTQRDGIMLHAFSIWWNSSHPNKLPIGTGNIAVVQLSDAHLAALNQFPGQIPTPPIQPPSQTEPPPPAQPSVPTQPTLPPTPSQPTLPPAPTPTSPKKSNTGLIIGGVAVVAAVAVAALAANSSSPSLQENRSRRRYR